MIVMGKIQQALLLWSTGALLQVAAQQPPYSTIPVEIPKRGNPGVPEHVLQMEEVLQSMTPENGDTPHKLQPTPPEEAPKRGMPGMPSQTGVPGTEGPQAIVPEIPVRRSPGMPDDKVFHRGPVYFPWQTGYIMPLKGPEELPTEPTEPPAPPAVENVAPPAAENKPEVAEPPPSAVAENTAPIPTNATPQQTEVAKELSADSAADRLRYERYLQQRADKLVTERGIMDQLLELTDGKRNSGLITEVLNKLAQLQQDDAATSLINAIDSVRDARRVIAARKQENAELQQKIDELIATNNSLQNRNSARQTKAAGQPGKSNMVLIAHNTYTISKLKATQQENEAIITTTAADARNSYEAFVAQLLSQGFYDHATIGARLCRHLFRDEGVGTAETMAARAQQLRQEVDKRMQAVNSMLQQNHLLGANEALEHAFSEGEHMFSVREFPTAERRRIANFRSLQKQLAGAMAAKDYNTAEQTIARLSAMSSDYDTAQELALCSQRKAESDMYLRQGASALKRKDEKAYTEAWQKAAELWPMNPNLDVSLELAEQLDGTDPLCDEFRLLMNRKAYREIYDNRLKFADVCTQPELAAQYRDVLDFITELDQELSRLATVVEQSPRIGAYMAYETLTNLAQQDKRCTDDRRYSEALYRYTFAAADYCKTLQRAAEREQQREFGAALSYYYRAQILYPESKQAAAKIHEISQLILSADFESNFSGMNGSEQQ